MSMYDNLYCKIFIDTYEERGNVLNPIKDIVPDAIEINNYSSVMEMDLGKNEDFNKRGMARKEDDYIYSRYYLDVEPKENIKQ